jgi:hypothetical protein
VTIPTTPHVGASPHSPQKGACCPAGDRSPTPPTLPGVRWQTTVPSFMAEALQRSLGYGL